MYSHVAGMVIGWTGTAIFTVFAFTENNITAIVVAIITAGGLILSTRNQKRIDALERAIQKRRVVAVRHRKGQQGPDGMLYDEDNPED